MVVRRAVRAQRFLRAAQADLRMREEKGAAALAALHAPPRKLLTAAEADAFYARLVEDSSRRTLKRCTTWSLPCTLQAGTCC